jgi:hypothetical protein
MVAPRGAGANGRGHVKLCPLRRRSRGERAPVKLLAALPLCRRSRRERHTTNQHMEEA